MTQHERTHTKEEPYKCEHCSKRFSRSDTKIVHERMHTKEKPYQCRYCTKTFSDISSKTRHERTHTKEKPYQCQYRDEFLTVKSQDKTRKDTYQQETLSM